MLYDLLRDNSSPGKEYKQGESASKIVHINQSNNYENVSRMRNTRDKFMAPKLGSINEDNLEQYEGTFKANEHRGYKLD